MAHKKRRAMMNWWGFAKCYCKLNCTNITWSHLYQNASIYFPTHSPKISRLTLIRWQYNSKSCIASWAAVAKKLNVNYKADNSRAASHVLSHCSENAFGPHSDAVHGAGSASARRLLAKIGNIFVIKEKQCLIISTTRNEALESPFPKLSTSFKSVEYLLGNGEINTGRLMQFAADRK